MELIDQHTKRIMEGCKERALDAGLKFDKETLEYMVTNTDMLELSPKNMIPTLYDFWLQDIQMLRGKGEYEYYPNNPYETVINTRPAISFYNNENPDWLNVMIFYHVLGHIDFFQNNKFFRQTWDYDFKQKALTEKRIIAKLRSLYGRKIDYVIEFTKGVDNLVGYFDALGETEDNSFFKFADKIDFYFNFFLQKEKIASMQSFLNEVERYNSLTSSEMMTKDEQFLWKIKAKHPEFEEIYQKYRKEKKSSTRNDLIMFLMNESKFINTEENLWMKDVIGIIRDTAIYFSPQIRTKVMNEGWASYWHEKLFMMDDRIKGNEVGFAKINAKVTSISKVGLNPYAIGWRLFMHIEDKVNKGRMTYEFDRLNDIEERKKYDSKFNTGRDFIFNVRENYCDQTFISSFIEQDFVDKHKLMVVGQRINELKNVKEYYVKSRKAEDYKKMIVGSLFHPPYIKFETDQFGTLFLNHIFEGKELYREYIPNTLIGLEYLWGAPVRLETTEIDWDTIKTLSNDTGAGVDDIKAAHPEVFQRVLYSTENRKVKKEMIN